MREQLIGYLLGALDKDEQAHVETELQINQQLRHDLEVLRTSVDVLHADRAPIEPPDGLAAQACQFVIQQIQLAQSHLMQRASSDNRPVDSGRWSLRDLTVVAGVLIAASVLFIPAINQSRASARLMICQDNLRQLGEALTGYSDHNHDVFPQIPAQGNLARSGVYAPVLNQQGYLKGSEVVVCPDSAQANEKKFNIPSMDDVVAAAGKSLNELQRRMGGSYAYTLGYKINGVYHDTVNRHRANFAIMADAPNSDCSHGASHAGCGQNVLFESGRVAYVKTCCVDGDNIYLNDRGVVAPGVQVNDAVLVGSSQPLDFMNVADER